MNLIPLQLKDEAKQYKRAILTSLQNNKNNNKKTTHAKKKIENTKDRHKKQQTTKQSSLANIDRRFLPIPHNQRSKFS